MSHVARTNESCHTYEWVMLHKYMSHVPHMKKSCHTYEGVMSHIWMAHGTQEHSYVGHDSFISFICATWLVCACDMTFLCVTRLIHFIYMWDMTHSFHSYVGHDLFVRVTWLFHICHMAHSFHLYVGHDSFISLLCETWPVRTCDISYVGHDSFISFVCGTWLIHFIHMWDMTCLYVWHDFFICVTWPIHFIRIWDMTHSFHSYVRHDLFVRVTWLFHMCHMTPSFHSYVGHGVFVCVTWRFCMRDTSRKSQTANSSAESFEMTHELDETHLVEFATFPWFLSLLNESSNSTNSTPISLISVEFVEFRFEFVEFRFECDELIFSRHLWLPSRLSEWSKFHELNQSFQCLISLSSWHMTHLIKSMNSTSHWTEPSHEVRDISMTSESYKRVIQIPRTQRVTSRTEHSLAQSFRTAIRFRDSSQLSSWHVNDFWVLPCNNPFQWLVSLSSWHDSSH